MKYRRLSIEELHSLEKEFTQFLASNHITAEDWKELKKEAKEKVDKLIEIFSDIVIQKTIDKITYLEYISENDIKTFHCLEDKIKLLGVSISSKEPIKFDLRNFNKVQDLIDFMKQPSLELHLYQAEKPYQISREKELFQLLESGCLISKEGTLYKMLSKSR